MSAIYDRSLIFNFKYLNNWDLILVYSSPKPHNTNGYPVGYPKSLLGRKDKTPQQKWIAGFGIPQVSLRVEWNCLYEVGREMGHPKTPIPVMDDLRHTLYLNKCDGTIVKVKINDCRHRTLYWIYGTIINICR